MPEYLAPGVYVEETSFRPKTIEGVGTSTAGFVGAARYGPVAGEPEILTSFLDFERIYGGLDQLDFDDEEPSTNHLAHGVRAFFENGGRRLYVSRVHTPADVADDAPAPNAEGRAVVTQPPTVNNQRFAIEARHPGAAGNVGVRFDLHVGPNALRQTAAGQPELRGVSRYDVVYLLQVEGAGNDATGEDAYWVDEDPTGRTILRNSEGDAGVVEVSTLTEVAVHPVSVSVTVGPQGRFGSEQTWEDLGLHPEHRSSITRVFAREPVGRLTELYAPLIIDAPGIDADNRLRIVASVAEGLTVAQHIRGIIENVRNPNEADEQNRQPGRPPVRTYHLTGGSDGQRPDANALAGRELEPGRRTGLNAFEDLDDISIVAAPGATAVDDVAVAQASMQRLVDHAERMRYRIAVLDPPAAQTVGEVRDFRGVFDSSHAALYYPWIVTDDPVTRAPISTPPSGFIAGIYARNDTDRGVHKAPANEIVRLANRFEFPLNTAQQEVLNPIGVNCLRFFEGRGHRVWGARTATSDPEWKYVNLRRYFAYVEHSVERATQWAVFEPNGSLLWAQVRRSVEDFLFNEFANRRLLGDAPEEAYFVKCDRSTITQNDLDNGRLVCLVGIAPLRPTEFVIFRIGQKTLDARA